MKNKRNIVLGLILLTSLTVFAASNINNNSTKVPNTQTISSDVPRFNPQRMEELKNKLKNGTATKSEMAEVADMMENKGGPRRNRNTTDGDKNNRKNANDFKKLDTEKMDGIRTKIKNGKKLTNEESQIVLEILERKERGNRGKNMTNFQETNMNNSTTVK